MFSQIKDRKLIEQNFHIKKNLSNGQFMIQGQFQRHFHSSLINNSKKYLTQRTNLPETKALIAHGTNLNTNFLLKLLTVLAKFMLAVRRMHVDPVRLLFIFNERILIIFKK